MLKIAINMIVFFNIFILGYFLVLNFFYLFLFATAARQLFYYKTRKKIRICKGSDCAINPSISLILTAYNEEVVIENSVDSLLKLDYSNYEIVVVNDGSTDNMMDVLKKKFKLFKAPMATDNIIQTQPVIATYKSATHHNLVVIEKENGRKADALNAGLNYSKGKLYCSLDADSILEKDALLKMVQPYLERDAKIVGLGGIIRLLNGCKVVNSEVVEARLPASSLARFQVIEYIRAFLCGRTGWSKLRNLFIISGAFGVLERKTVVKIGGYRSSTIGEDLDLVIRLHKYMTDQKKNYRMVFIPDPVVWTQAPDTVKQLSRQRNRWQRGLMDCMWYNRKMIFNPRYGAVGMIGMPYYLVFEMFSPLIEFFGYVAFLFSYIFGLVNYDFAVLFLLLAIVFGIVLSLLALLIEEFTVKRYETPKDMFILFIYAILENFGYRQMHSFWRMMGFFDYLRGKKEWGEMKREAI